MTAPAAVFVDAARQLWGEAWVGAASHALRVDKRRLQRLARAVHEGDQLATVPDGWLTESAMMMREHAATLMQLADSLARPQVNARTPVVTDATGSAAPTPSLHPSAPAATAKDGGAPMNRPRGRI